MAENYGFVDRKRSVWETLDVVRRLIYVIEDFIGIHKWVLRYWGESGLIRSVDQSCGCANFLVLVIVIISKPLLHPPARRSVHRIPSKIVVWYSPYPFELWRDSMLLIAENAQREGTSMHREA